jgi:hypothetical protein
MFVILTHLHFFVLGALLCHPIMQNFRRKAGRVANSSETLIPDGTSVEASVATAPFDVKGEGALLPTAFSSTRPLIGRGSKRRFLTDPQGTDDSEPGSTSNSNSNNNNNARGQTKIVMDDAAAAEDALKVPFMYAILALLLISVVAGRKLVAACLKKDLWSNPIITSPSAGSGSGGGGKTPRALHRRFSTFGGTDESASTGLTNLSASVVTRKPPSAVGNETGDIELQSTTSSSFNYFPDFQDSAHSTFLTRDMILRLVGALPTRFGLKEWRLLYATAEHGTSLAQFYRRVRHQGATLTVIQDTNNYIFGVFVTESWHKSTAHFGNGESLVMRIHPTFHAYVADGGGGGFS